MAGKCTVRCKTAGGLRWWWWYYGRKVRTIDNKKENLLVVSKQIVLEVNAENTNYMAMSLDQNTGGSQYVEIDDSSFKGVDDFKYLGKPEQIRIVFRKKLGLDDSGNACCHSVQNNLSSIFLFKIKFYITLIFLGEE